MSGIAGIVAKLETIFYYFPVLILITVSDMAGAS